MRKAYKLRIADRAGAGMMRVLRTEYDGRIVLNPPDAIAFVASSRAGAAGVIFAGTDLVVSTVYTTLIASVRVLCSRVGAYRIFHVVQILR